MSSLKTRISPSESGAQTRPPVVGAVLLALTLLVSGYLIENSSGLAMLRAQLRNETVPTEIVEAARTTRLLKSLDILRPAERDVAETTSDMVNDPGGVRYEINAAWRYPPPMLSPTSFWDLACAQVRFAQRDEAVLPDLPVVSVIIPEADLAELRNNRDARGRLWERRAAFALYDEGHVCVASDVGIRLHGGDYKRAAESPSFRLYFRRQYGKPVLRTPVLPWTVDSDVDEVVLRKDHAFITPLAFDLSHRIGAIVPPYHPVMLYLNGRHEGLYTLTRRVNSELASEYFDDPGILCYRYKGKQDQQSRKAFTDLHRWLAETPSPLTMSNAARHIDPDNFSCQILSIMYCGTKDGIQGAAVLPADGKWQWINWDMDGSFIDRRTAFDGLSDSPSPRPSVELLTYGRRWYADQYQPIEPRDFRSLLFLRLCEESPEFRSFFNATVQRVLDEELQKDSVDGILAQYEQHLPYLDGTEQADFARITHFLKHRSTEVRSQIRIYLRE